MGTALLVLQFLPLFLQVVQDVEGLVQGAKQGSVKKQAAIDIVNVGLQAAQQQGAIKADDAKTIQQAAPTVVDGLVGVLNGLGVFKAPQS